MLPNYFQILFSDVKQTKDDGHNYDFIGGILNYITYVTSQTALKVS